MTILRRGTCASEKAQRAVWCAVTRTPHASVRELSRSSGYSFSIVASALRLLDARGYIVQEPGRARARRVVLPFHVPETPHGKHP